MLDRSGSTRTLPRGAPAQPEARSWHAGPLASLDLETTGRDPRGDRILAIALFRQEPDGSPVPIVDTLVDPGADVVIPDGAAAVHGITRERLVAEQAPPLTEVLVQVHAALMRLATENTAIVIYNAPFDWPFLEAELARLDPALELPDCALVDPLVLDRHVDKWRKGKRTLEAAAGVYGVTLDDAHEAAADALASLGVARAIGRTYLDIGAMCADDLHALQVTAHGAWRDDFNAYLRRIGADRDPVTGDWPGLDRHLQAT
jgi:DNA polymerase-3 subunit epsilon